MDCWLLVSLLILSSSSQVLPVHKNAKKSPMIYTYEAGHPYYCTFGSIEAAQALNGGFSLVCAERFQNMVYYTRDGTPMYPFLKYGTSSGFVLNCTTDISHGSLECNGLIHSSCPVFCDRGYRALVTSVTCDLAGPDSNISAAWSHPQPCSPVEPPTSTKKQNDSGMSSITVAGNSRQNVWMVPKIIYWMIVLVVLFIIVVGIIWHRRVKGHELRKGMRAECSSDPLVRTPDDQPGANATLSNSIRDSLLMGAIDAENTTGSQAVSLPQTVSKIDPSLPRSQCDDDSLTRGLSREAHAPNVPKVADQPGNKSVNPAMPPDCREPLAPAKPEIGNAGCVSRTGSHRSLDSNPSPITVDEPAFDSTGLSDKHINEYPSVGFAGVLHVCYDGNAYDKGRTWAAPPPHDIQQELSLRSETSFGRVDKRCKKIPLKMNDPEEESITTQPSPQTDSWEPLLGKAADGVPEKECDGFEETSIERCTVNVKKLKLAKKDDYLVLLRALEPKLEDYVLDCWSRGLLRTLKNLKTCKWEWENNRSQGSKCCFAEFLLEKIAHHGHTIPDLVDYFIRNRNREIVRLILGIHYSAAEEAKCKGYCQKRYKL